MSARHTHRESVRADVVERIASVIVNSPDATNSLFEQFQPTNAEVRVIQVRIRELRRDAAKTRQNGL